MDEDTKTPESAPAPAPALPPAAAAVVESDAKESDAAELVELRRKLSESESAKKQVELRAMELEDNLRSLSTPPKPTPQRPKRSPNTFFDDEGED